MIVLTSRAQLSPNRRKSSPFTSTSSVGAVARPGNSIWFSGFMVFWRCPGVLATRACSKGQMGQGVSRRRLGQAVAPNSLINRVSKKQHSRQNALMQGRDSPCWQKPVGRPPNRRGFIRTAWASLSCCPVAGACPIVGVPVSTKRWETGGFGVVEGRFVLGCFPPCLGGVCSW